jgi:hypothetical protein
MRAAERVNKFIASPTINNKDNDTRVQQGRRLVTTQYRFSATEAGKLVKAILAQPDAKTQGALVRELHRRTRSLNGGQISFITDASSRTMNALAKQLKISVKFETNGDRDSTIKSKHPTYTSKPSMSWNWYVKNTVLGQLPGLGDEESDKPELKKLGMTKSGNRWTAPDGTWVRYSGGYLDRLGFQRWHLGQLPYNNRLSSS